VIHARGALFEMDAGCGRRASKVLTRLGKTYSHNLRIVERPGKIGIKCRILCAQIRRGVASGREVVEYGGESMPNVSFLSQNPEPNRGCQNQSLKRPPAASAIGSLPALGLACHVLPPFKFRIFKRDVALSPDIDQSK
jgi:hypothetical protein